jgi:hypothetical protein
MIWFIRRRSIWAIAAGAVALAGCSLHPLPDDVSIYSTEEIVRNVRCEAKEAVRQRIQEALFEAGITDINPEEVLKDRNIARIRRKNPVLAAKFFAYGVSTIAYRFDFHIVEYNHNDASVNFAAPFTTGEFTLALGGKLHKDRDGHRTFTTAERFEKLVNLRCEGWVQPGPNIVYPVTGSIGVGKMINAFIDVSELGGGHEKFTDNITFTTVVRGKINPVLELVPVMNQFRVVKAEGIFESKRNDIHNVKVSLAFPNLSRVHAIRALGMRSVRALSDETRDRALVNICIAEGEDRENRFGVLRDVSPTDYCSRIRP